jgi:hypothetical protein
MTKRAMPDYKEALQLVASLETHCRQLRESSVDVHAAADELEALLADIRSRLSRSQG